MLFLASCAAQTPQIAGEDSVRSGGDDLHVHDPAAHEVAFVAFGDGGDGARATRLVARAAKEACAGQCSFGVLLGDNVYPRGIDDASDARWDSAIEQPFAAFGLPLYAVLGNHDYGAPRELWLLGGLGVDRRRADAALARARTSDMVSMPARAYRVIAGPTELVLFDSQPAYFADAPALASLLGVDEDAARIDRALAMFDLQAGARWRIALAHHPYRSNGAHGDAGSYDGLPCAGGPFSGAAIRGLLERRVLGRYALYLAAHDHNLFDMGDERGTALIVSGGASEHRDVASTRPVPFAAAALGFVLVRATRFSLAVEIYTVDDDASASPGRWRLAHARTIATKGGT